MIQGWVAAITLLLYPLVCYGIGWVVVKLKRPVLIRVALLLDWASDVIEGLLRPRPELDNGL